MYQKPQLERFGTFRELTLGGGLFKNDGLTNKIGDGCLDPKIKGTAECLFS